MILLLYTRSYLNLSLLLLDIFHEIPIEFPFSHKIWKMACKLTMKANYILCYNFIPLQIMLVIVSITKFSMVIGSSHTCRHTISRGCPITGFTTFCNWTPVIGYPRDWHINYMCFNGFLCHFLQCFLQLLKLMKSATDVFAQKNLSKDIFNSQICYRYDY